VQHWSSGKGGPTIWDTFLVILHTPSPAFVFMYCKYTLKFAK